MKFLTFIKLFITSHTYVSIVGGILIAGTATVAVINSLPSPNNTTKPTTVTSQGNSTNNSSSAPNNVQAQTNSTPDTNTQPNSSSNPTTSSPNTSNTTPYSSLGSTTNNSSSTEAPTCDTQAEATYQTEYMATYNKDRENGQQQLEATGYSPPYTGSAVAVVQPIEENFVTEVTNLEIQWGNEMTSIHCTNSPPETDTSLLQ